PCLPRQSNRRLLVPARHPRRPAPGHAAFLAFPSEAHASPRLLASHAQARRNRSPCSPPLHARFRAAASRPEQSALGPAVVDCLPNAAERRKRTALPERRRRAPPP